MMKFFRQYTKQLLAIFMALLLIVWLGGTALTDMLHSQRDVGKSVEGTAYGETVRLQDMWPAFKETETLDEMGLRVWQAPWYVTLGELGFQNAQQFGGEIRQSLLTKPEWYMLDAAAKHAHVHVAPKALEDFKAKIGLTPDALNILRQRTKKPIEDVDEALMSFIRVQEAAVRAVQAFKISEADINEMVRETGEKARIAAVIIEAKSFVDTAYQPSEQEILAQFEKYKNVASRPGEVGYEQAAAAQIEYIEVSSDQLVKNQKISDEEARSYWEGHLTEFMKPPASRPATSTAPASQPIPYPFFSEARLKVLAKMQKDKAQAEAQRIARELIARLQGPWSKITTTQPEDAKTAPDSEKSADLYSKLVDQSQAKYPGVMKYGRLELLEQPEIAKQPVGSATALPNSEQQITAAEAAFLVPGVEKPADKARTQRHYRGLYETAPEPFIGSNGNAYVVRTVAIRDKQAPAKLDAVRNQIVQDIRNDRAYEAAEKAAQKLSEEAGQKGLEAALNADATLKQKLGPDAVKHPEPFSAKMLFTYGMPRLMASGVSALSMYPDFQGRGNEFLDKLFALASKTTTQPNKITTVEEKSRKRFIVAQLQEILPVTREEYNKERMSALQLLEMQHRLGALRNWFQPEQIRARVSWVEAPRPKPAPEESSDKS